MRGRVAAVALGLFGCGVIALFEAHDDRLSWLSLMLGVAAVASGAAVAERTETTSISASFIVVILAASFLGPASACGAWILAELTSAWRRHNSARLLLINLFAGVAPALAAANLIRALRPMHDGELGFYAVVIVASVAYLVLNFAIVAVLGRLLDAGRWDIKAALEYIPSLVLNIALAVAGARLYVKLGYSGMFFALAAVAAFSYMAHLLGRARTRAQQYVSLSWGVLAGLLRALDERDRRAARHAAAVARFAADIATAVGMSQRDRELAHTAGLLHDIGHFALSDRVAERARTLTDEDWSAIQRHPELGADILRDLGMYGPVAEIVHCHHERIDGRGYPRRLPVEEIPEIAKIVAVAEVYDTLTASDTYRTRMSSFEALTELRRVAGTQLDARYVEVLAALLGGEGLAYRHADDADFDSELAMERRISEAASA